MTLILRALVACLAFAAAVGAQPLPDFDFTREGTAREWGAPHHISALQPSAAGLEITISGHDPYFHGPARDYPPYTSLWAIVRLKSDQAGAGEVFYFRDHAEPGKSVSFTVPAGEWTEARMRLPALGPNYRLRLDPPGTSGKVVLASMRFEKRVSLPAATWPQWKSPAAATNRAAADSALALFYGESTPFGIELRVGGDSVAFGHPRPRIAYLQGGEVRWVDFSDVSLRHKPAAKLIITANTRDADGAQWTYQQTFSAHSSGAIATETTVSVDQDRSVVWLPMHMLIAGEKSFGPHKGQGLFAGLEYLENEPSSSEADIVGPESKRQVPASHKITFPLMAIQSSNSYVGLIWEPHAFGSLVKPRFSALFDSPDRTFGSGGHLMGVVFPGSDGVNREEGSLLPYYSEVIKANQPLISRAWLIGGIGTTVVPAIQQYVKLRGLPSLPDTRLNFSNYVALATQGWLASKCREGNLYRHAVWPGFNGQPAADAAVFETWLAAHTRDAVQSKTLRTAASEALSAVKPRDYYHSAVGHVRTPAAPLVFGGVREATEAARQVARSQLGRFAADGSIPYRAGATDYGKTHFAPDANGLTAQVVLALLEAAAFCGDRELIGQAIEKLRALDKFTGTVPRGAQTWEVPLHTPDILAAAHLVRAYALGYELTGNRQFLEQSIYWAWTGVPFVYLTNPTERQVGPYSTIAVLGATSWKAPVWFGRPVQWCGMVYADALYRLARHDTNGSWRTLADGITSAGLQHTWPAEDRERVGLLPDFFELPSQTRAGPAINPATVGSSAVRLYDQAPLHEFQVLRRRGLIIHAPGVIAVESDTASSAKFTVGGWPKEPYFVLVTGFTNAPVVTVNGALAPHEFHATEGQLILKVTGAAEVSID